VKEIQPQLEDQKLHEDGKMNFFNTCSHPEGSNKKGIKPNHILKKGMIRVGTTGDYKPFTFYNPHTEKFEGYDIAMAQMLAGDLGVKLVFIETTWANMLDDLLANRFDIAMGGISWNLEREQSVLMTDPYFIDGKVALIRKEDTHRFTALHDIDLPEVRIGLNPGGTNEKFVKSIIRRAHIVIVPHNLDIPEMVASNKVDVMITDCIEARYYENQNDLLFAALTDLPFTKAPMVYMVPKENSDFLNWVNQWMEKSKITDQWQKEKQAWGLSSFN
jgi:cyclohexadienyl dehydratase